LLGIKTEGDTQVIYVDTPGIHKDEPRAINRYMNRSATSVINDVDVIVFVIERLTWSAEDEVVLERIMNARAPVILAVNKVDQLDDKTKLLPFLEEVSAKADFANIIPLSALRQDNLDQLELAISQFIPENVHFFPEDQITDRTERFLGAEIVREKIMRQLGHELPYQVTVEIEQFAEENGILHIGAVILVERDSQKAIVIGKGGTKMRTIGREARLDMESLFDQKVMLNLWVKVKRGWSDDERALRSLGYDEF
jgi:GTP-binding protein Era